MQFENDYRKRKSICNWISPRTIQNITSLQWTWLGHNKSVRSRLLSMSKSSQNIKVIHMSIKFNIIQHVEHSDKTDLILFALKDERILK